MQVLKLLERGFSPEAVAGRLGVREGQTGHRPRDDLPLHLRPDRSDQKLRLATLFAPRQGEARLPRRKGGSAALHILGRVPIAQRPAQLL